VKIETPMQSVSLNDLPNPQNITQIVVNLQDQTIEVTYRGHQWPSYSGIPALSIDAATYSPMDDQP
jgi:hypothetical protein